MKRYFVIFLMVIAFFAVTGSSVEASTDAFGHVRGRFLIDVDQRGEMWYVHPVSGKRYLVDSPKSTFALMHSLGLGITNADLGRIPDGDDEFIIASELRHTAGRILIRVQNGGEAWYVHPITLRRYRLGEPVEAWRTMIGLALGIRHADLMQISRGIFLLPSAYQAVPFTMQAPFAEWNERRQREGCEEASALMAVRWARSQGLTFAEARERIIAASEYELEHLGFYEDTSVEDTAKYILQGFFGFTSFEVRHDITVADIAAELAAGRVVLVPVEGRALGNPNFPGRSPFRHMLLIIGYDSETDEFITHDPGTRLGRNYRYSSDIMQFALLDYTSGFHEPVISGQTGMIAVGK